MTPLAIRRQAAIAQNTKAHATVRREAIAKLVTAEPYSDDARHALHAITDHDGVEILLDEQQARKVADMAQFHNEPSSPSKDAGSAMVGVLIGVALAGMLWACVDLARWHVAGAEPPVGVEVER